LRCKNNVKYLNVIVRLYFTVKTYLFLYLNKKGQDYIGLKKNIG